MTKTYVPTARLTIYQTHRYLTRWQTKMTPFLTAPQIVCLTNLINALAECLVAFGQTPVED